MNANSTRQPAVLLLGPTGSGKTPLGEQIETNGLRAARCLHFDFGANLREVVQRDCPDETVRREDIDFLRAVLHGGALLEDEQFPLAERILRSFLARRGADAETLVILNGLPRHVGQAAALDTLLDVRTVIHLSCSGETVQRRIESNVGGDRSERVDDDLEAVRTKLAVFQQRTAPLLEFYRARGTTIETLEVGVAMTPEEAWRVLESGGGRQ